MNKTVAQIKKRILKFHLIDLIGVAIFLACVVLIVVAFLRRTEYVNVTLRISNEKTFLPLWQNNPADWYIANLKEGTLDKDFLGRTNLEITKLNYYPVTNTTQAVYVTIRVRSVYNKTSNQYLYNGIPVLIGELQTFKLGGVSIQGVVIDVSASSVEPEKKSFIVKGVLETQYNEDIKYPLNIRFKGIRTFLADNVKKGMVVKDNHGNVIAEILDVKKSAGQQQFPSGDTIVSAPDPDREQVELTVRFITTQIDGRYLYREEEPLTLGHFLNLDFPDFTVFMTLMDVKPE